MNKITELINTLDPDMIHCSCCNKWVNKEKIIALNLNTKLYQYICKYCATVSPKINDFNKKLIYYNEYNY